MTGCCNNLYFDGLQQARKYRKSLRKLRKAKEEIRSMQQKTLDSIAEVHQAAISAAKTKGAPSPRDVALSVHQAVEKQLGDARAQVAKEMEKAKQSSFFCCLCCLLAFS